MPPDIIMKPMCHTVYTFLPNIKDMVIRAKVAIKTREQRNLLGMKKCNNCIGCVFVKEGKSIATKSGTWKINKRVA